VTRPSTLLLPHVILDRSSSSPLQQQIRLQLADAVRSGDYAGRHLPSSRSLARLLGVSRNTVLAAYDELAADGLIEGRRGSRMAISGAPSRGLHALDPKRMLSEAQFPERTVTIVDPDGTPLYLRY
jgi:GntR family transcriptional regulator/MocR family aminotransferase